MEMITKKTDCVSDETPHIYIKSKH